MNNKQKNKDKKKTPSKIKNKTKTNEQNKKKVIVVGGGFAGALCAKELEGEFDLTLIDTKTYFEFTPGILRVLVKPQYIKHVQILHTHYLKFAKFIKGRAIKFSKNSLTLQTKNHNKNIKKELNFDYLIITTGSSYASPIKQNIPILNRATELRKYFSNLKKAKTVLIIGGGYTGVELAAEIATKFESEIKNKEKEIILVHPKSRIIHNLPKKASEYATRFLKEHKIKIILNNRITKMGSKTCISTSTTNGNKNNSEKICADLVFICTGITPNNELVNASMPSKLDNKKQVRTTSFLQLHGESNIFVAGDVSNIDLIKTAQNAERQAQIIINNIRNLEHKKHLIEYCPKANPMIISLGKYDGILIYKNLTLRGLIPGLMKGFVECMFMRKLK